MEFAVAVANTPSNFSNSSVIDRPNEAGPTIADVMQALRRTGVAELRMIDAEIENQGVVLRGSVGSYYLKQRAQIAVLAIPGVEWVRNGLVVVREFSGFTSSE